MALVIPEGTFVIKEGLFHETFNAKNDHKSSLIKELVKYNLTTLGRMPSVLMGYNFEIINPDVINEERYRCTARIQVLIDRPATPQEVEWANNQLDGDLEDPITFEKIKKQWVNSPRFIKIHRYVFNLDSVLKSMFSSPLIDGRIKHPVETRALSEAEHNRLLKDLSELFKMDKGMIMKCFSPFSFQPDWQKLSTTCAKDITGWFAMSLHKQEEILTDIFLNIFLEKQFPSFKTAPDPVKCLMAAQYKSDLFPALRLYNFFLNVDDDVLKTRIYSSDEESYDLFSLQRSVIEKLESFGGFS